MIPADGLPDTRRTVLVVDDFDDTRLLLRTWFERRGFRVIEAENGVEAMKKAILIYLACFSFFFCLFFVTIKPEIKLAV